MNLFRTLLLGAVFSQVSQRGITAEKDNQISNVTGPNKLPQPAVDSSQIILSREEINRPQNEQFNVEILEKELSVSLKEAKNEKEAIDSIASILKKFGLTDEQIKDMQRKLESKYEELKNEGPKALQNYIISFIATMIMSKVKNIAIESKPSRALLNRFNFETAGQKEEKINSRLAAHEAQQSAGKERSSGLGSTISEIQTEDFKLKAVNAPKVKKSFTNRVKNQRKAEKNGRSV
jgi:hypothetical protein